MLKYVSLYVYELQNGNYLGKVFTYTEKSRYKNEWQEKNTI